MVLVDVEERGEITQSRRADSRGIPALFLWDDQAPERSTCFALFDELLLNVFIAHLSAYPWLLLADCLAFHAIQRDYVRWVTAGRVYIYCTQRVFFSACMDVMYFYFN